MKIEYPADRPPLNFKRSMSTGSGSPPNSPPPKAKADKPTASTPPVVSRHSSSAPVLVELDDPEDKQRQAWAKSQIIDIDTSARTELESLEALRGQQQEIYQEQLAEKNDVWVKLIAQRREEAAQLRSMISSLSAAISSARLQAKNEIDGAKRRASASTKSLRAQHLKQLDQIATIQQTIQAERRQYEHDLSQFSAQSESAAGGKKEQIERLKVLLGNLQAKLGAKQAQNEAKFAEQVQAIQALRTQLQEVREGENAKQTELMSMRKVCASMAKRISARKDEAASLKRQYQMLKRDNEELENEINKVESGVGERA
jgi:chromosome segregation ATPase